MIIEKIPTGKHGAAIKYAVCNDATETGDTRPHTVAMFDTLEQAIAVKRYMQGCTLTRDEQTIAEMAIIKATACTVERKDSRKTARQTKEESPAKEYYTEAVAENQERTARA